MYLEVFVYLQLLDLMATLVGFKIGAQEASPFIRLLLAAGPAAGVVASKLVAVLLAGFCVWRQKHHIVRWINYWYAALVVWNLCIILVLQLR